MSRDFLVFQSGSTLSREQGNRIKEMLSQVVPGLPVIVCEPGDSVSMPMDSRLLHDSIAGLCKCVNDLVQTNQQVLSVLVSMVDEPADESAAIPKSFLSGKPR